MVNYSERGYIETNISASKKVELGEYEASERIGIGLHLPNRDIEALKELIANQHFHK